MKRHQYKTKAPPHQTKVRLCHKIKAYFVSEISKYFTSLERAKMIFQNN
jgi:hypothetical protein